MKELEKVDELVENQTHAGGDSSAAAAKRRLPEIPWREGERQVISVDMLKTDPDHVYRTIYIWAKVSDKLNVNMCYSLILT
jgi:hypothetical protein